MKPKLKRTWKRQLAVVAFLFWCAISIKVFFLTPVADIPAYVGIYSTISLAVWSFVTAAFGLHAIQENGLPTLPQTDGEEHAE